MSFTTDIKQEIANNELKDHCQKAQLSALLQLTSSLTIGKGGLGLSVRSENATTVKRIMVLLKNIYEIKAELQVTKKTNLKRNNVYRLKIENNATDILEDLGIYTAKGLQSHPTYGIIAKECCARAYLAGAFLAYGSCNSPNKSGYHLEISLSDIEHANYIGKLIARFDIEAKIVKRRNRYVVYLKKADFISGFLALIGAHNAMMEFEDERISRDMKNSLTRIDNCEIANEIKTIKAAEKQVAYMEKLKNSRKYEFINDKLKNVIELRLMHQDYSLLELCEVYQNTYGEAISKSGMKHRLNKIEAMAEKIEE